MFTIFLQDILLIVVGIQLNNFIITLLGQIMATLANKEAKKGYGLPVSMKLPKLSELYLPFYTAIPGVNYALALLMALEVIK